MRRGTAACPRRPLRAGIREDRVPFDDLAVFADELTAFERGLDELRRAQALPADELRPAFEAVLLDLDEAVGRLWPVHRMLTERQGGGAEHTKREAQLLRAVFHEFPVPVLLLDRDSVVRRLNRSAAELVGSGPGYATGRPLSGFVAPAHRAAFRSHVSAVARTGEPRSVLVRTAAGPPGALQVTLVALQPPGEARNAVLAAVQTEGRLPVPPPQGRDLDRAPGPPGAVRGGSDEETRRDTVHLDLLDAMTTALLGAGAENAAGVLRRASAVLHGEVADWIVGDLLGEAGPRRCVVLGPPGPEAGELAAGLLGQTPDASPLVVSAFGTANVVVQLHPEDVESFGRDREGTAVLARLRATSLVCLPLCPAPPDARGTGVRPVRGVLTLFRTGGREPFGLAEVALLDRMSRHVALRLERGPRGADGA